MLLSEVLTHVSKLAKISSVMRAEVGSSVHFRQCSGSAHYTFNPFPPSVPILHRLVKLSILI